MANEHDITASPEHVSETPTAGARLAAVVAMVVLLGATLLQLYWSSSLDGRQVKDFAYTADAAYAHLAVARDLAAPARENGAARVGGAPHADGAGRMGGAASRPGVHRPGDGPARLENRPESSARLAESSSPAWTLVLAGLMRTPALTAESGRSADEIALVPLVVNLVSAALLVLVAGHLVSGEVRSAFWMFVLLVAMGVFIMLPAVVMTGLEHVLLACVAMLLVGAGVRMACADRRSFMLMVLVVLLAAVSVGLRFEALGIAVGLLLWGWTQRRTGRMLFPLLAGLVVVLASGVLLWQNGAGWLPAPVRQWGRLLGPNWRDWYGTVFAHLQQSVTQAPVLWALLIMAAVLLGGSRAAVHSPDPAARSRVGWLFVFLAAAFAHLKFGEVGGYQETYLVVLGTVAVARTLAAMAFVERCGQAAPGPTVPGPATLGPTVPGPATLRERLVGQPPANAGAGCPRGSLLVVLLAVAPIVVVAWPCLSGVVGSWQAGRDAFVRERLTASFVRTYFPAGLVATNNAGVVEYETSARAVDLWLKAGIAKPQAADGAQVADGAQAADGEQVADGAQAADGAQVALVNGAAPRVVVPSGWKLIGGWHRVATPRDSSSAVRVYAVSDAMAMDVNAALRQTSVAEQRPADVAYWFAEPSPAPATRVSEARDAAVDRWVKAGIAKPQAANGATNLQAADGATNLQAADGATNLQAADGATNLQTTDGVGNLQAADGVANVRAADGVGKLQATRVVMTGDCSKCHGQAGRNVNWD